MSDGDILEIVGGEQVWGVAALAAAGTLLEIRDGDGDVRLRVLLEDSGGGVYTLRLTSLEVGGVVNICTVAIDTTGAITLSNQVLSLNVNTAGDLSVTNVDGVFNLTAAGYAELKGGTAGFEGSTADGLVLKGSKLAFYGGNAITKPEVTGSAGGNAALASLLAELANLGLITDGSS